jgi:hypothetical protein
MELNCRANEDDVMKNCNVGRDKIPSLQPACLVLTSSLEQEIKWRSTINVGQADEITAKTNNLCK